MNTRIIVGALTLLVTAAIAAAQAPNAGQQKSSPQVTVRPTTTLAGCLYREGQVPGRKPDIVERAGILEDYILADATITGGQERPTATAGSTATSGAIPSTGNMYKVEKIAAERLKALVGKRVEVTGHIDPEGSSRLGVGGAKPDAGLGPDKISLPEIEASSIRGVSGTCPVTASPAQVR
jgi:hypothetical protein